jgi:hypothetical protein
LPSYIIPLITAAYHSCTTKPASAGSEEEVFVMAEELNPAVWPKAAAEIRDFLGGFKALQLALEEAGGLEKRTAALRAEEASILAARGKAAAEAVAAQLARVEALKRKEANLTTTVVRLREEAAAAQETLSTLTEKLKEKLRTRFTICT